MRVAALALALCGCDNLFGIRTVYRAPDAPPLRLDAFGMPLDAAACMGGTTAYGMNGPHGEGLLGVCATAPMTDLSFGMSLDTGAGICTQHITLDTVGTQACLIIARNITLSSVMVTGKEPLVLVASGTLSIIGSVDVASHAGRPLAAGANWGPCPISAGLDDDAGPSGGAGGSDGSRGGSGGIAGNLFGGPAYDPFPSPAIHGGCPGGPGGSTTVVAGGAGGDGGGALYLIAGSTIAMSAGAIINASGAGGSGGRAGATIATSGAGGGGGGAGGFIGLDAPTVSMDSSAKLCANGGGGGAGGAPLVAGASGGEPQPDAVRMPAAGGVATVSNTIIYGGAGGDGFALGTQASGGQASFGTGGGAGGGGGGGGAITVFAKSASLSTEISPMALVPQ